MGIVGGKEGRGKQRNTNSRLTDMDNGRIDLGGGGRTAGVSKEEKGRTSVTATIKGKKTSVACESQPIET